MINDNSQLVTVAIDVANDILQQRLRNREGDAAAKVLGVLDFYGKQHVVMRAKTMPDITLADDYDLSKTAKEIVERCT